LLGTPDSRKDWQGDERGLRAVCGGEDPGGQAGGGRAEAVYARRRAGRERGQSTLWQEIEGIAPSSCLSVGVTEVEAAAMAHEEERRQVPRRDECVGFGRRRKHGAATSLPTSVLVAGILEILLSLPTKTPHSRSSVVGGGLAEDRKEKQGEKGGSGRVPWRCLPSPAVSPTSVLTEERPRRQAAKREQDTARRGGSLPRRLRPPLLVETTRK
jgi:hypothetical protein